MKTKRDHSSFSKLGLEELTLIGLNGLTFVFIK